ncbi:MAG TPA: hypothetical protein EYP79_02435 [Campylobacterales bacterium]|nr:hypothetical protein [Campylobacterales bacterium]
MKKVVLSLIALLIFSWAESISVEKSGSEELLIRKIVTNTNLNINYTNGDIENLHNILKKDGAYAIAQRDILDDITKNKPEVANRLIIVSPLQKQYIFLIAHKESDIHGLKDLQGRTVIVGKKGSGSFYTFLSLQNSLNIVCEIFNLPLDEAIRVFKNDKRSVLFYVGNKDKLLYLEPFYRLIPVSQPGLRLESIILNNKEYVTSVMDKFILTTKDKLSMLNKSDLNIILTNLLNYSDRDYLCGFKDNITQIESKAYIYFACAKNIKTTNKKRLKVNIKDIVYDDIEDIVIYPMALKNKNFVGYNTSYLVEKTKLNNAINLFKKELQENPEIKLIIISYGRASEVFYFLNKIYKTFKKAKIPRGAIIKKSIPIKDSCKSDCFYETKIKFKLL